MVLWISSIVSCTVTPSRPQAASQGSLPSPPLSLSCPPLPNPPHQHAYSTYPPSSLSPLELHMTPVFKSSLSPSSLPRLTAC